MAQITYTNKVALNENPEIANVNKVTDDDMNEIKQVVNDNYNYTIQITTNEPTDEDGKIWINPNDVVIRQDNIVKTTYNESDDNTYSTNYINNNFGGKILWTNSSPSSAISTQIINNIDMTNYDIIEIVFRQYNSDEQLTYNKFYKNIGNINTLTYSEAGSDYWIIRSRKITMTSNTSINLQQGYQNVNGNISSSNNICIPVYIIGYKTNLFS